MIFFFGLGARVGHKHTIFQLCLLLHCLQPDLHLIVHSFKCLTFPLQIDIKPVKQCQNLGQEQNDHHIQSLREQTCDDAAFEDNVLVSICSTRTLRSSSPMYFTLRSLDFAAEIRLARILRILPEKYWISANQTTIWRLDPLI